MGGVPAERLRRLESFELNRKVEAKTNKVASRHSNTDLYSWFLFGPGSYDDVDLFSLPFTRKKESFFSLAFHNSYLY